MSKQDWKASGIPNLFSLRGHYYLRVKPKGQARIREALHTGNKTIAINRMRDRLLELGLQRQQAAEGTWGGLVEKWQQWLNGKKTAGDIEQSTIDYKNELVEAIRGTPTRVGTWPGFDHEKLSDTTSLQLTEWRSRHRAKYCATRTNGAITVIRELLELARELKLMPEEHREELLRGITFTRVKYDYKRLTLQLPSHAEVDKLELEVYRRCKVRGTLGGYLFSFLRYSGCRIDSARHVHRCDVFRDKNELYFRVAKYGPYSIPLFPQLLALIDKIEANVPGDKDDLLLPTVSLQTVLGSACKALGLPHLSHHDIRHVFATRLIEQGKDIPLVAAWMGHKDGGRTCMNTYGHLRKSHSMAEAATVKL